MMRLCISASWYKEGAEGWNVLRACLCEWVHFLHWCCLVTAPLDRPCNQVCSLMPGGYLHWWFTGWPGVHGRQAWWHYRGCGSRGRCSGGESKHEAQATVTITVAACGSCLIQLSVLHQLNVCSNLKQPSQEVAQGCWTRGLWKTLRVSSAKLSVERRSSCPSSQGA